MQPIKGFSKLSREQKIEYLRETYGLGAEFDETLASFRHPKLQEVFDNFSENTLSNYYLPFGVAPNFLINGRLYAVPMVIEESSVVAAASRAASFWAKNGGFRVEVLGTVKTGDLWFEWHGSEAELRKHEEELKDLLRREVSPVTASMEKRGGGIIQLELLSSDQGHHTAGTTSGSVSQNVSAGESKHGSATGAGKVTDEYAATGTPHSSPSLPFVYRLKAYFETADSMGANFINTVLEAMKEPILDFFREKQLGEPEIIMAILSNNYPGCIVKCSVECPVEALKPYAGTFTPTEFARRFKLAVDIATANVDRAVTHNKGIYNGVDAVILATGNDFRAIEAAGHAYASRNGRYTSLSECSVVDDHFTMSLCLPMAVGTVGGLTRLHPLARKALEIMQEPSAAELMGIAAAAGLANNFSAVASLVTTGIQKGHMKLHLPNILNSLDASEEEKQAAFEYFNSHTVSVKAVKDFIEQRRKQ